MLSYSFDETVRMISLLIIIVGKRVEGGQCRILLRTVPKHLQNRLLALETLMGGLHNHLLHRGVLGVRDYHRLHVRRYILPP